MAGDKLLVCTDGLTDMLNDQKLRDALVASAGNPAATLADAGVEAGGRDNVTAVVVAI